MSLLLISTSSFWRKIKFPQLVKLVTSKSRHFSTTAVGIATTSGTVSLALKFTKFGPTLSAAASTQITTRFPHTKASLKFDPSEVKNSNQLKMVRPPGIAYSWELETWTPDRIKDLSSNIVEKVNERFDSVAKADKLSFDTVLNPILMSYREFYGYGNGMAGITVVPLMIAESPELREAATQAKKLYDETTVDLSMRKDVFEKLVAYQKNLDDGAENIDPEYRRALDKIIRSGKKNGLHLDDKTRESVSEVKKKILDLELQFTRNLIEFKAQLLFTKEELAGMPSDFIESLKTDEETGKHIVTLEYPHLFPVLKNCHVPETRKQLSIANASKCYKENTKLLEDLLELRYQEATLLSYENHACYILDGENIASNPKVVREFLDDLAEKLQPLWKKEKEIMLQLKKEDCEKYGYENSGKLEVWDTSYYSNLVEEKFYNLDHQELKAYFPADAVTSGLLSIYQDLLGLKFTFLPKAEKWHKDVNVYQVNDRESDELMGYFFLDLFPRDGKYGHACWIPMQTNVPDESGKRLPVVGAMLCNFTKPAGDKPALLTHSEVETFFHEFGHLMHGMCTKAKTQLFFGTNVERDFLEAPSQMLENWVWEKEPLQRMSRHFQTGVPLPDDLIEKLKSTKKVNAGSFNLRQIVFATFDQLIHEKGRCDTEKIYAETLKVKNHFLSCKIQGFDAVPGTNFAAGFGHIGKEYSARYYSYLWSEVFSMDMYSTRFANNNMNPEAGTLYRKTILEPGGSVDGNEMLRNFLGRDPKSDAFLESKGVEVK